MQLCDYVGDQRVKNTAHLRVEVVEMPEYVRTAISQSLSLALEKAK